MPKSKLDSIAPIPVRRAMRKLGQDIRHARIRRRIQTASMAERAFISRTTLSKIERGDLGVALGHYATVLFALGMIDRLGDIADVRDDLLGLDLAEEQLPQRVHHSRARQLLGAQTRLAKKG